MLKSDRIGLVTILASLVAIAVIVSLIFVYQRDDRIADIRTQGVSLARVLSGVEYRQLLPGGGQHGLLQVVRLSGARGDLAYIGIVQADGDPVHESTTGSFLLPEPALPAEPSAWVGEKQLALPGDGRRVIEFHAPLFDAGELQGFVRLGYLYPPLGVDAAQVPFLGAVALPVFLLAPFFYLLLRREVRPIRAANEEMGNLLRGDAFRRLEIAATGELGDFMQRFNRYIENAASRVASLENEQQQLLTSSKLLAYRKNRIETVLETLPEAILIVDETGTITFANGKLAAMFRTDTETILSKPPQAWCDNPDVLMLLSGLASDGKSVHFNETIRFNVRATADRSIATKTFPLVSARKPGQAIGTLILFRDETQEAMARQARADFVAHLAHELKSPLNVLALYSETMLSEAGQSEEFRVEAANVIAEEVDRLSSLISGLLNMSQIESGSLTAERSIVKLTDVAKAAFEEARHSAADKNYRFEIDVPKEMNPVHVDKDLIRIAITNLLSNAVKYNRDGGEVRLTIEETEDAVQIRVADTGIGISREDAERIFDKFYRAGSEDVQAIGGHGLGLALTKQIVELHHGTLSVDTERPEGSEFIINLWKESTAVRQAI